MKPIKATREQLKRHNRQLVLRAVYCGLADNRAALAQETGLAKPTVSDIIGELIAEGLIVESGRGESTDSGGKRPTILRFVPNARQVIGVSVESHSVVGVLSNIDGTIVAQHHIAFKNTENQNRLMLLYRVINGLLAQKDAPLLCIGVGVPGAVDNTSGYVQYSPHRELSRLALADLLSAHYHTPVYVGNNGELAALAQFAFGVDANTPSENLVTLLLADSAEVGVVLSGAAYHRGSDIGSLQIRVHEHVTRLTRALTWPQVCARVKALRAQLGGSALPHEGLTYFHIKYHAKYGDPVAQTLINELSEGLAQIMAWIIGLLRPDHISLAGAIVNLGDSFLEDVSKRTTTWIAPELTYRIAFSLAYSDNLSAIGAVALALKRELDIL